MSNQVDLRAMGVRARKAARGLATLSVVVRNRALQAMAQALQDFQNEVLEANAHDMREARSAGLPEKVQDRLLLNAQRLESIAADVRTVASLPDPLGETFDMRTLPNGLIVGKTRVPLGVMAAVYEARPNVTVDIASLCLKAGNACILRGGKEAMQSNLALARVIGNALHEAGVPDGAVQVVESADRALVGELLSMRDYIDVVVPRGGAELIKMVQDNAKMPVLIGGAGVCHTYVDKDADVEMAAEIALNAKCRRPTICNALDTLVVHAEVLNTALPLIARRWTDAGVTMHCDRRSLEALRRAKIEGLRAEPIAEGEYDREWLSLNASVKTVDSLDEAIDHVYEHSTGHSEAIVTEDYSASRRFLREVDSAVVYVNASTQFTDGGQFGLGAEIIDSTQKFHARGPVGLKEITTYKWVVMGNGQVRPA